MWAPWREKYIKTFQDGTNTGCFICDAVHNMDEENNKKLLIVGRRKHCIAMLNKYPYNSGHTLVAPNRHVADITELQPEELFDIILLIQEVSEIHKKLFSPHGTNIGANIGQSAGAGLPGHVHFHIVPRWNGDANFTAIFADVKVISSDIEAMQEQMFSLLSKSKI